jgi:anti-anti-sigma factor
LSLLQKEPTVVRSGHSETEGHTEQVRRVAPLLEIEERVDPTGVRHVALRGELDLASAPAAELRLRRLKRDSGCVRLDLTGLEFVDAVGVRVLLLVCHASEDGAAGTPVETEGELAPPVRRVLELVAPQLLP